MTADQQGKPPSPSGAEQNLRENQQQLDLDGIMVGVSRQALDEVLAELTRLRSGRAAALEEAAKVADREKAAAERILAKANARYKDRHLLAAFGSNSDPDAEVINAEAMRDMADGIANLIRALSPPSHSTEGEKD